MRPSELKPEIPRAISLNAEITPVYIAITTGLISRFSSLTGDTSHLHMNKHFARRSIYRQQVAHGMLPVAVVSLLPILSHKGYICLPQQLQCQFIEPIFIDDEVALLGKLTEVNKETGVCQLGFTVTKRNNGAEALNGSMQVTFVPSSSLAVSITPVRTEGDKQNCLQPLKIMEQVLADIAVDDTDSFPFTITKKDIADLTMILAEGTDNDKQYRTEEVSKLFYLPNLLAIMLFSTSVGVCIPGKYATFLSFEANVHEHINKNHDYFLHGKVSHVSQGTRIIKKKISITEKKDSSDNALITGAVKVLVNTPPVVMPGIRELREESLDYGLRGKTALITGASRGIGETIAKFLALHGAKVVVNFFRGEKDAKRVVEEIISENGQAIAVQADVRDEEQVGIMIEQVIRQFGEITILVNNAVGDFKPVPFHRLIWGDIQNDIDIVVKGAFNCCKQVLPYMLKKGNGKIINLGTIATDSPPANQVKYVISKSGLVGLTRCLSVEYAAKNIQVNMVVPSFVETDLVAHIPEVYRKKIARETPMGRNAYPADIAQAVLFLASSYSSFTTGQKIFVTGGGVPFA